MIEFFKHFFAVDNKINENTVMGLAAFLVALVFAVSSIFFALPEDSVYLFLGFSAVAFGFGSFKK